MSKSRTESASVWSPTAEASREAHAAGEAIMTHVPYAIADIKVGERHRRDLGAIDALAASMAADGLLQPVVISPDGERMLAGRPSANFSEGRALDKIAKATGVHRTTLAKAEAVVDAAEAEPERFGKLLADMDRTGRVNGVFKRLKVAKQAARIRAEPPPLPGNGPYRGGMVDVPWAYEPDDDAPDERAVLPYPTMSIEQACLLDVGSIMHNKDSVLGFWVTNFILAQGLHVPVLRAWGFAPKAILTWPKDRPGRGHWLKGQTEHLVIATRGNPVVTLGDQTTLLRGPFHLVRKATHSAKPIEAYSFFESLVPAPRYADLFSRYRHNDKWDCHGDETPPVEPEAEPPAAPAQPSAPLDAIPEFLRRPTL